MQCFTSNPNEKDLLHKDTMVHEQWLFGSNSIKMTRMLAHRMAPSDSCFWLSNLNITSVGLFTLWVSRSDASGSVINHVSPVPRPED